MKDVKSARKALSGLFRRASAATMSALNVLLLLGVVILYVLCIDTYESRLREENIVNVANLNRSAAINITALFESWNVKLDDVAKYIESRDMSVDEALEFLCESNSDNNRTFQIIGSDYVGYTARQDKNGGFAKADYSNASYAPLQAALDSSAQNNGKMHFAPEFTDADTALKSIAIYKRVTLQNENGESEEYTILLATRSKDALAALNLQYDYVGQSTVLTDAEGNYIFGNKEFKSTNFFKYLEVYNNLTLDARNEVKAEMARNGKGEIYYKNAGIEIKDCLYRYERLDLDGWYCITCVPIDSFHASAFNLNYIVYAIVLLFTLFTADILWLQGMNRRLRVSMRREKEASAAKGNFLSRMSHEIRTPLNAVIGYNTIALNELTHAKESNDKNAETSVLNCLTKSDMASKHLLSIINDVLDMSAIESGKITVANDRFDLKGLITSLSTVFYSRASEKGIKFEVLLGELSEEWFLGDQLRVNQILTNLLANALKFTPENGEVTLRIDMAEANARECHIRFEVRDTGIGMSAEYMSHLWTPFEQADSSISRRFGGTGLGLSITKTLVDMMKGDIKVESALGKGTVFKVDLPFERTEQPSDTGAYDFGNVNALVVDDDISTCEYIRLLFNRCGARCAAVTSGEDAVKAVSNAIKNGESYTVCLVDWQMPQMDGIETIRRIRELMGANAPLIVLTAYDYSGITEIAEQAGVSKIVSKPLFQSSLFDLLAGLSASQSQGQGSKENGAIFAGERVLLAEDNMMNMEIAKTVMESAGLKVDGAWNGREAADMFIASEPGTYKVILMDIHMPEMDGHEATGKIRASKHPEAKTIPIIAMTADAFAENVAEAIASGMNDHIAKPIDLNTLFGTLRKYMR